LACLDTRGHPNRTGPCPNEAIECQASRNLLWITGIERASLHRDTSDAILQALAEPGMRAVADWESLELEVGNCQSSQAASSWRGDSTKNCPESDGRHSAHAPMRALLPNCGLVRTSARVPGREEASSMELGLALRSERNCSRSCMACFESGLLQVSA